MLLQANKQQQRKSAVDQLKGEWASLPIYACKEREREGKERTSKANIYSNLWPFAMTNSHQKSTCMPFRPIKIINLPLTWKGLTYNMLVGCWCIFRLRSFSCITTGKPPLTVAVKPGMNLGT